MIKNGLPLLLLLAAVISTGAAIKCNRCPYGFLNSTQALYGCYAAGSYNLLECPMNVKYCLKTEGPYNYSYTGGFTWGSGNSSDSYFRDCATPELITFLFNGQTVPANDSSYCKHDLQIFGRVPGVPTQTFGLNGTVCLCQGDGCNTGSGRFANILLFLLPAALALEFFAKR